MCLHEYSSLLNAPPYSRHVHDTITHGEKGPSREWLGEEVSKVVLGTHERDTQLVLLDALANKEMSAFDVLHPTLMCRRTVGPVLPVGEVAVVSRAASGEPASEASGLKAVPARAPGANGTPQGV